MPESKTISVSEYRKMIGEVREVTCPSGAVMKIRRLTPMNYIKEGMADIPNEFFKFIAEFNAGIIKEPDSEQMKKNYELFEKFLKITVEQGIVEPLTILKYDKDKQETHLIYSELTPEDQEFLINVITGRAEIM